MESLIHFTQSTEFASVALFRSLKFCAIIAYRKICEFCMPQSIVYNGASLKGPKSTIYLTSLEMPSFVVPT